MATTAFATPVQLVGPGYLFLAPLASSLPTPTVTGSVFTDTWPVAWLPLGATNGGSEFDYAVKVDPMVVEEFLDPISYATTSREGSIKFNLADFNLDNLSRALNGGVAAIAPTSGTGATALTTITPPTPGSEVRAMVGFESYDHTFRAVFFQALQSASVNLSFKKAPDYSVIPFEYRLEVPASGIPFQFWGAGAGRD